MSRECLVGIAAVFVAGLLAGLLIRGEDQRVVRLQAYADSLRRADSVDVAAALDFATSERRRADSLQAERQRVRVVVRTDSAAVAERRAAVAVAQTARDSNAVLVEQVVVLERQVAAYEALSQLDSLTILTERTRGDSLLRVVVGLNDDIRTLTSKVAKLRPMPKWARVSLEIVKLSAVGYAGFKAGQASAR